MRSTASHRTRAPTILIVDDDREVRLALRLLFEFEQFDVKDEASNGLDAVRLARQHQPDFVVLDYRIPTLNGAEVASRLRFVSPSSSIVAFSCTLDCKPEWANACLDKLRIAEIVPLLESLSSDTVVELRR
jgi:DNA-binding NarL/FixJ family response regulator